MRNSLQILILIAFVFVGFGCTERSEVAANDTPAEEIAIPVQVDYPTRSDIAAYFETTARVQAENRVEVIAKGTGQCLDVRVEEGDMVKAEQILAELDKEELEAQIRQTQVNLEQQKTAYEIAERSLQEGIGSKVERDNSRFAYESAKATLDAQEVQLSHQTVRSPIDGVVTQRNIQKGMLISSGMPAFTIVDPSSYILPIFPPEKELMRLRVGQEAKVTIDSHENEEFVARVRRINPSVDPTSGTVKVTLDFEEAARALLREASFARVRLVMETHENALIVPKDVILEENARKYVMVVRDKGTQENEVQETGVPATEAESASPVPEEGTSTQNEAALLAERVEVKVGLEDSDHVEILSGIDEQTRIVTLGQHTLKSGSTVTITNAEKEILSRATMSVEQALTTASTKSFS